MGKWEQSAATFSSWKELQQIETQFVNLHDVLLQRLDSSGNSAEEGTIRSTQSEMLQ